MRPVMDVLQPTAELDSPVIESLDPVDWQKVVAHYDRSRTANRVRIR